MWTVHTYLKQLVYLAYTLALFWSQLSEIAVSDLPPFCISSVWIISSRLSVSRIFFSSLQATVTSSLIPKAFFFSCNIHMWQELSWNFRWCETWNVHLWGEEEHCTSRPSKTKVGHIGHWIGTFMHGLDLENFAAALCCIWAYIWAQWYLQFDVIIMPPPFFSGNWVKQPSNPWNQQGWSPTYCRVHLSGASDSLKVQSMCPPTWFHISFRIVNSPQRNTIMLRCNTKQQQWFPGLFHVLMFQSTAIYDPL